MSVGNKKIAFMVHYRNPYIFMGGSEKFIDTQIVQLSEKGIETVILFPLRKIVFNRELFAWGIVKDKKLLSFKSTATLQRYIKSSFSDNAVYGLIIHSVIGVNFDDFQAVLSMFNKIIFYIHDFSSCCVNRNLIKNGQEYCGNGEISALKCFDCSSYEKSKQLHKDMMKLIENNPNIYFIAPSESTKKIWEQSFAQYKERVRVIPHKIVSWQIRNPKEPVSDRKIKIAFVGAASHIKGWNKWIECVDKLSPSKDYDFFYLGESSFIDKNINSISVSIKKDGQNAMIKALSGNDIDIAVLFSCGPETYSFTYFEAYYADVFVITSDMSGNIADQVSCNGNGVAVDYYKGLYAYLSDVERVKEDLNKYYNNKICIPEKTMDNFDYFSYLGEGAENEGALYPKSLRNGVNAALLALLYRLRYCLHL